MSSYAIPIGLPRRRRIVTPAEWLREKIREREAEREATIAQAVAIDRANLGTGAATGATSVNITTSASVATGGMIAMLIFVFHTGGAVNTTLTGSGGGLTWVVAHSSVSVNVRLALVYAFCPSGLAASSTITANAAEAADITCCAASYTGIDTSGTVVAFNASAASSTAWASGTVAGNSGDAYIGGSGGDGTLSTSTPTSPAVERIDFNSATSSGSITLVDKIGGNASDSLAGTWTNSITQIGIGVAFKPLAAAAAAPPRQPVVPTAAVQRAASY